MRTLALALTVAALAAGGIATAGRRTAAPEAREIGKPVSCISLSRIQESRVRNDNVIDFKVSGNKWYRNTLPRGCPSLGFEERFSYATSINQLCSTDIIHVLQSYGSGVHQGAGCGLGKFQPVEIVKTPKAK